DFVFEKTKSTPFVRSLPLKNHLTQNSCEHRNFQECAHRELISAHVEVILDLNELTSRKHAKKSSMARISFDYGNNQFQKPTNCSQKLGSF
ncbi:MAG: hypothetical protein SFU25_08785, partial [Candidatus Caenarcaniphilales bacterium]|nr:hypothetical protein [Candidatus Caenarcaniphilales bacterium]